MTNVETVLGFFAVMGLIAFIFVAMRPGRIEGHFTDKDADGEPDASSVEKRAVIEEFRRHQRDLHGD